MFNLNQSMSNVSSTTWSKMLEIPCDTSSVESIISALRQFTDFFDGIEDDEISRDYIFGEFGEVCSDGIIIWEG